MRLEILPRMRNCNAILNICREIVVPYTVCVQNTPIYVPNFSNISSAKVNQFALETPTHALSRCFNKYLENAAVTIDNGQQW